MNYWLSREKTEKGHSRLAMWNVKPRGLTYWVGAAVVHRDTPPGVYTLENGTDTIGVRLPADWGAVRCVVDEEWEREDIYAE